MRMLLFYLLLGSTSVLFQGLTSVTANAGKLDNDSAFTQLQTFLDQKDYFRLRATLEEKAPQLSVRDRAYFEAFVDNAFGHMESSQELIRGLLGSNYLSLTERQQYLLWILLGNNYYKMGQYRLARESCDSLLLRYKNLVDASQSEDLANNRMLWHALEDVPPMEVVPGGQPNLPGGHSDPSADHSSIPWKRDAAGLMNVPVRKDTSIYDFVFDTGAGLSTISETFAHQLRLRLRAAEVDVQSSTGIHNRSTLAVADSLYLGNILLKNVVFLVLPDDRLSFPQIHYSIRAILGMPVICLLQEVHIRREGTLSITAPVNAQSSNLAMDGWTPIVSVGAAGDTLSFYLDTGATTTDLFSPYYHKHLGQVLQSGRPEISRRGGAGGIVKTEVYRLTDFPLSVGGQQIRLPHIDVLARPANESEGEKYYGTLGQDVIGQFPEMVLNFKYMYLAFLP
jgi:hypothetical protein